MLGGREFNHQFLECSLPTEEAGLLGMDFMKDSGAIVDLQCNKMSLADIGKVPRANGKTLKESTALRSLWRVKRDTALNASDGKLGVWTSRSQPTPPARELLPQLGAWLVNARKTTMAPRSQQVVIGKLEFGQEREPPCVY